MILRIVRICRRGGLYTGGSVVCLGCTLAAVWFASVAHWRRCGLPWLHTRDDVVSPDCTLGAVWFALIAHWERCGLHRLYTGGSVVYPWLRMILRRRGEFFRMRLSIICACPIYRPNNCGNVNEYLVHSGENVDRLSFRIVLVYVAFRFPKRADVLINKGSARAGTYLCP